MSFVKNLNVLAARIDVRFEVNHESSCVTQGMKSIKININNISRSGFMATGFHVDFPGSRIAIWLPQVGYRDAVAIWTIDNCTGFILERPVRLEPFVEMLLAMGYSARPMRASPRQNV
jgi:hypothetical protein